MSVKKVTGWFSKPGKGFAQVELKNFDGTAMVEDGKPVTGNEQFQSEQLTDDSIDGTSAEAFMEDVLEATGGDVSFAARAFRTGWNKITRNESGGLDPYQKAAKNILKLDLSNYKGMSVDDIAALLRAKS